MRYVSMLSEMWAFLKTRKKFWLMPLIIILLVLGVAISLTAGSALAPFIYAVF